MRHWVKVNEKWRALAVRSANSQHGIQDLGVGKFLIKNAPKTRTVVKKTKYGKSADIAW